MRMRVFRKGIKKVVAFTAALSLAVTSNSFGMAGRGYAEAAENLKISDNRKQAVTEITDMDDIYEKSNKSRVSVHDPSIIKDTDGTYYIFGSHLAWAKSKDLENWTAFSNNISTDYETLFAEEFEWARAGDSVYQPSGNVWAPDVIWNESMQKWCMYMSINGCSWNSSICLLTADKLDGDWTYVGPVVYSGFTENDVSDGIHSFEKTDYKEVTGNDTLDANFIRNPYSEKDNGTSCAATTWNKGYGAHAIDACVFYDEDGKLWFSYGSWSGGIYIFELDGETGFRKNTTEAKANYTDSYMGKKIGGSSASGEASYIEYINGYYYLFISYGGLVANGGYQMRVFRSQNPDGPYTDVSGDLATAGGTIDGKIGTRLMSYYKWSWWDYAHVAQGHNSAFVDDDGKAYVIYHTRTNDGTEGHTVRVHQLFTSENGYLVAAPFEYTSTDSVNDSGYTTSEIAGTYEILFQKNTNSASLEYNKPQVVNLSENGDITGDVTGTWTTKDNSPLVSMEINGIVYEGTFVKQDMEGTNVQTLCFTIVGTDDICLWGSKYPSDDVAVAMTADMVTLPKIITNDIELKTEGLFGTSIEWEGNSSLLSDGTVIPPVIDRSCTITATITKGDYVFYKKFDTTIMSEAGDSARKVASYFDTAPLELSNDNIKSFENPLYGLNIKNGVTIKFNATRKIAVGPLATIFSFNLDSTGDPDGGRFYMTNSTYLGYNAEGGFFDANMKDYTFVTDYIGDGTAEIEIRIMPDGYSVYSNGKFAYSNETVANGTTEGTGTVSDYRKVLDWLSKTAAYLNFGTGTWAAWRDQGAFNGTISNFEIWAEPVKETSLGSNYYYYQDYEDVTNVSELTWDNTGANAVALELKNDNTNYLKMTNSGSGGRVTHDFFNLAEEPSGEFYISFDIAYKASTQTHTGESQIVVGGTDMTNKTNQVVSSGYILKLSNTANNQKFIINDTSDTVELPSNGWINIRLDMDNDRTKALLTIKDSSGGIIGTIDGKEISINGTGNISGGAAGLCFSFVRGNASVCIDNIAIGKPGAADYEELDKAIKSGEKYIKLSDIQETYTSASMDVLKNAVNTAKAIDRSLASEDQEIIDNAEKDIIDAIKALECANHEYTNTDYIQMPTCTEQGRANQICCLCGKDETKREADVDALGHTAGEWEVITPATTTSEGEKVKKCIRCSEIMKTASIDKLPWDNEPEITPPVTPPVNPDDASLKEGLMAEYLFDGNLIDSKNPSKQAEIIGEEDDNKPVIVKDASRGNVMEMRGTWQATGYIKIDKSYVNNINNVFTVTMWAKANNSKTGEDGICGKNTSIFNFKTTPDSWQEGTDAYKPGFVSLDASLHPWINDFAENNNWVDRKDEEINLSSSKWQQVTMSIDGSSDKIYVYVDGKLAETVNGLGGGTCASLIESIKQNTTEIQIGTFLPWWNAWDFRGYVDDIRFYDRLLTDEEIAKLYSRAGDSSIAESETAEPTETPSGTTKPSQPTQKPSDPGNSGGNSSGGGFGGGYQPSVTAAPTVKPTATPKVTATPKATIAPTAKPVVTPTPVPGGSGSSGEVTNPLPTVTPNVPDNNNNNQDNNKDSGKKVKKGTAFTNNKTKAVYKVINTGTNAKVEYIGSKASKATKIAIPKKVTYNGVKYKVTSIGKKAFAGNKKLKEVTISKNVTSINDKAFSNCKKLSLVKISSNVKKIGKKAFYGCKNLRYIRIESNNLKLSDIGKKAFAGGYKTPRVKVKKNKVKLYKDILLKKGLSSKAVFVTGSTKLVK